MKIYLTALSHSTFRMPTQKDLTCSPSRNNLSHYLVDDDARYKTYQYLATGIGRSLIPGDRCRYWGNTGRDVKNNHVPTFGTLIVIKIQGDIAVVTDNKRQLQLHCSDLRLMTGTLTQRTLTLSQ